jgi:hypothetical protein
MTKYISRPAPHPTKSQWWDEGPLKPHLTVYETDQLVFTGLYDQNGDALHKQVGVPIGFIHLKN